MNLVGIFKRSTWKWFFSFYKYQKNKMELQKVIKLKLDILTKNNDVSYFFVILTYYVFIEFKFNKIYPVS